MHYSSVLWSTLALIMGLAAPCLADGAAPTVDSVVDRHLTWLSNVDNFQAKLRITSNAGTYDADLFVDYDRDTEVYHDTLGGQMPDGLLNRIVRSGKTFRSEVANDIKQPGFVTTESVLGVSAFADGSDELFRKGDSLAATRARLDTIGSASVEAVGNDVVLRVALNGPAVYGMVAAISVSMNDTRQPVELRTSEPLDHFLTVEDIGNELAVTFASDGRVRAVAVQGAKDHSTVTFDYTGINLPPEEIARLLVPLATDPGIGLTALAGGATTNLFQGRRPMEYVGLSALWVVSAALALLAFVILRRALSSGRLDEVG